MKRNPALYTLSHDHHQGLILAQQLKKGAPQYKGMPSTLEDKKEYTISFYKTELVKHFQDEEEILFPSVKNKNDELDRKIAEIISEHRMMESLIKDLEETDQLQNVLDELGWLLEKHIRKEERDVFMEIENVLTEEELQVISQEISQSRK
jgi:iron-sulfur cluster repair protein YtfE (RIC family)